MRFKQVGNKEDLVGVVVKNNDTVTINVGQPVVLSMDGAGVDVVLPSTAASIQLIWGLRYGVCLKTMIVGAYSEAQVFGFSNNLAIILQTRANSGASWSTMGALSIGEWLSIDTVNNYFSTQAYGQIVGGTLSNVALSTAAVSLPVITLTMQDPPAVIGQSLTAIPMPGGGTYILTAGSASSTACTVTALTVSVQAFVRMM